MAKGKLSSRRNTKKEISVEDQEKALNQLKKKKSTSTKDFSRVTIDFPLDVYGEMKQMVKDEGRTLKGYIIGLVKKDLKER